MQEKRTLERVVLHGYRQTIFLPCSFPQKINAVLGGIQNSLPHRLFRIHINPG
jgi:hypothetical protein